MPENTGPRTASNLRAVLSQSVHRRPGPFAGGVRVDVHRVGALVVTDPTGHGHGAGTTPDTAPPAVRVPCGAVLPAARSVSRHDDTP